MSWTQARASRWHPMSDADYFDKMKSKCVITEQGCWEMQSFRRMPRGMDHRGPEYGYGLMYFRGKNWTTHRLSWTLTHGPIPKGMIVMHTCDNPPCCNPDHLRIGTYKENSQDARSKGRSDRQWQTHCGRGHAFTPENTYIPPGCNSRHCRTCSRMRQRGEITSPAPRLRRAAA